MLTISMIIKDEEKVLARGLDSVISLADQIVIVDTGSTDNSVKIAKKYTDQVYHFDWTEDFGAARNFSASFATNPYVMKWDADFVIDQDSLERLKTLKKDYFKNADLINIVLNTDFSPSGKVLKSTKYEFIYKKEKLKWVGISHDRLGPINEGSSKVRSHYFYDIFINNLKDRSKQYRYDQNIKNLERELKKDPNDALALNFLIDSYLYKEDYSTALKLMRRFLDSPQDDIARVNYIAVISKMVFIYQKRGEYKRAKDLAIKHKELQREDPVYLLTLGDAILPFDLDEAEKLYMKYLSLDHNPLRLSGYLDNERDFVHPNLMLAGITVQKGEKTRAEEYAKRARELTHSDETETLLSKIGL